MSRIFVALVTAAVVTAAAPASAMSFQFSLPSLTFPPQPVPDASQGCSDVTALNGAACVAPTK